eukprot:TCALIF_05774-PA protein Name:"Protein of unknown function" AED:0.01 eAED:0.01 QI:0/1/0.66/1/0.5/0.33/3/319/282
MPSILGITLICAITFTLVNKHTNLPNKVIFWWMLGVFLSQSRSAGFARNRKVHLMMVLWIFFTMCLDHFYGSNFRANLIAVDYEPSPDSAEDLVNLGRRLYVPEGTTFLSMLDDHPDTNYQILGQIARQEGLFFGYDQQGLIESKTEQDILQNEDGFITNEYMGLATFDNLEIRHGGQNPIRFSRQALLALTGHFPLQLNSPYKYEIDHVILRLQEGGIINHIRESYIKPKFLLKSQDQQVQLEPFLLKHVLTSLFILCGGLILSGAILILEYFTPKYHIFK